MDRDEHETRTDVEAAPDDRCGFSYDVSTLPGVGACTCWRPTWGDSDYCVWHAPDETKDPEDLAELAPTPGERIDGADLEHVSLDGTDWFRECTLIGTTFDEVDVRGADMSETDLREAVFEDVDARRTDFSWANLEDAEVTASDFRDADLSETYFDQTVFSNVRINRGTEFGDQSVYDELLADTDDDETYRKRAQAAIWAYREIGRLHEDNAIAYEARQYYLAEKDVRRRLAWFTGHYPRAFRAEAARWFTGYGMSPWRVVGTAFVVIVLCALLYPTTGGLEETVAEGQTITYTIEDPESTPQFVLVDVFFRSLYFSVVTFATLGYGDISPVGDFARALAGIEALLGQALMAVLVFVLTRRIS